jgi:DNA-binding MurR/RpiR family transcriptional regulator
MAAIRSRLPNLNPAEAKVARVLLAAGDELIYRSASEVAQDAGAALSTVVRTCKALGFKGYQDLKIACARENHPISPSELADEVTPDDSPKVVLAKLGQAAKEALDYGLPHVDDGQFEDAVAAITASNQVLCLGVGTSAPLAADAGYRFVWIGIDSYAPSDFHVQHVRCTLLEPGDVALVISHTGSTHELVTCARAAAATGAKVIAVTSFPRSPLTEVADIVLVAASRETAYRTEALVSRLAHLAVLDALWVATAVSRGDQALEQSRRIADVISEHRY